MNSSLKSEAIFERRWLIDPEQFNPTRSARTQAESERLLHLLPIQVGKRACDLGVGYGHVAKTLSEAGMKVDAVDISRNCLKRLHLPGVDFIQDCFPHTKLESGVYDLVVASNLIAEIPERERRLAVSEIARLLTPQGQAILSTPIDIYSDDACLNFLALLETEFEIDTLVFSYHRLSIQLPIFTHSLWLLRFFENLAHFFWQDRAISHAIASVKRRPLTLASHPVQDRKPKKSVWE